jgi:catechol 2,3-dioxygenase-like lactoylglutathione lyase family enzyme
MSARADRTSSRPVLAAAEPQLFVSNIAASCDFFTAKLGFSIAFVYGDPPFYAQVARDAARLNLRHVDGPVIDSAIRDREVLLSASIAVDDVDRLYAEFQTAGVAVHQALRGEPWGARTFIIKDPDGNLLLFSGDGD